jgi:hypothetical protein
MSPTIYDLVSQYEAEVVREEARESCAKREIDVILNDAKASGRKNLTVDEEKRSDALFSEVDKAREARDAAKVKLGNARKVQAEEDESDRRSREVRSTPVRTSGVVHYPPPWP